jgi:hypothetical protein
VAIGVVALLVGASAAGGLAWATIPNSTSGVITVCFSKTLATKTLRVIDAQAGQKCTVSESTLSWQANGQTKAQVQALIAANAPRPKFFTSNGSYVVPAGVANVEIIAVGGGGGGGGNLGSGSGGGGGQGASLTVLAGVVAGHVLGVQIGQAGTAGSYSGETCVAATPGTAGTDTVVTDGATTLVDAAGGGAGQPGTVYCPSPPMPDQGGPGGPGGSATSTVGVTTVVGSSGASGANGNWGGCEGAGGGAVGVAGSGGSGLSPFACDPTSAQNGYAEIIAD